MERIMRWGVLGTGHILGKAGAALKSAGNGRWLGVAGRTAGNSRAAAAKFEVPRSYNGYEELLRDPDIDAVYIALLNHLHKEWAIKACEAGKHVLLEKPFAMDAAEAADIEAAARAAGVYVEEAFVWRCHPAFAAIRELLQAGAIGEWVRFRGHYSFMAPPESTRWSQGFGGGALLDIGCYPVSWARYFAGEEPLSASAEALMDARCEVDRRFAGTLYFSGGRTAVFDVALDLPHGAEFELIGTKGRLTTTLAADSQAWTIRCRQEGSEQGWSTDRVTPFRLQAERFAEKALAGDWNGTVTTDGGPEAVKQARAMTALREAAAQRARVAVCHN